MRSTFAGLNTMVSGLQNHQLALDTVGHNLSNDSTEGYSRQSVNLTTVAPSDQITMYGKSYVGNGVDTASITRARDIFADKHYWRDNATKSYYEEKQNNYSTIENVFNDSQINSENVGLKSTINKFWKSWQDLSTDASNDDSRISVRDTGATMADQIKTMAQQMQQQITSQYGQLQSDVTEVNNITSQLADLNKNIRQAEASGGMANDLRDKRDSLVDKLSQYVKVDVTVQSDGSYSISSNGSVLVDGDSKLTLDLQAQNNDEYGITDYNLVFKETGTIYNPANGEISAVQDNVAEDKSYIDKLANYSAFFLTTFNAQHKEGYGIDGANTTDTNFFGENANSYSWINNSASTYEKPYMEKTTASGSEKLRGINIINELTVNTKITDPGGTDYIAARGANVYTNNEPDPVTGAKKGDYIDASGNIVDYDHRIMAKNGTAGGADGSNAVTLSTLFDTSLSEAAINDHVRLIAGSDGNVLTPGDTLSSTNDKSLYSYYNDAMTELGTASSVADNNVTKMGAVVTQLDNARQAVSGVNWNEELTNMIKYQQGYSACARVLTTMDEMLDKLINSTGTVGR
ncbi:flagellar hook-associated protein FlgK [Pectinatus brassicae]|uniref:Flagellar hook-associated protein 1 n=1 Tax=Pectinatus brassicae TaxID=862415 RepID=A0A840UWP1_9FIRM|nr:flagellar hook-associated protein FlgK [Pectinatus brassicae]MBB5336825.1 flagellar hook-associated protein 1 FlgK [Pectinatus brassicae]